MDKYIEVLAWDNWLSVLDKHILHNRLLELDKYITAN